MRKAEWKTLWRELAPVEHGSWGLLLIPLAMGSLLSREGFLYQFLMTASAIGFFLARKPALRWFRAFKTFEGRPHAPIRPSRALLLSGGIAVLFGAPLLSAGRGYLLAAAGLAVGLIASEAFLPDVRSRHPLWTELFEIWILCLLAPGAYYAGTGRLDQAAALAWVLCVLYFSVSVVDVRLRLAKFRVARGLASETLLAERQRERGITWTLSGLGALSLLIVLPQKAPVLGSLIPLFVRPWLRRKAVIRPQDIAALGWSEVWLSLVFAILASWLI